jgi:hypothetical protein
MNAATDNDTNFPGTFEFENRTDGAGVKNFTFNAEGMLSIFADPKSPAGATSAASLIEKYASGHAVSLLQDNQDATAPAYDNASEPVTYTGTVTSADVSLAWDEHVDWSQVDDKGHWKTTKGQVPTGVSSGNSATHTVTTQYISNYGSPANLNGFHSHCHSGPYTTTSDTYGQHSFGHYDNHAGAHDDYPNGPSYGFHNTGTHYGWHQFDHYERTGSTTTTNNGFHCLNHSAEYQEVCHAESLLSGTHSINSGSKPYYYPSSIAPNRFGWVTSDASPSFTAYNGGLKSSYWGDTGAASNPPWALNKPGYWQDTAVTGMSNNGATTKLNRSPSWIYNTSDPIYAGRNMYGPAGIVTAPWNNYFQDDYGNYYGCVYNNRTVSNGAQASTTYYPSQSFLYENTSNPVGQTQGHWNNVVYDGNADGQVDTGWQWIANLARVRYEYSFDCSSVAGHSTQPNFCHNRKLGVRKVDGTSGSDNVLYGLEHDKAIRAGRDNTSIYNPMIAIGSGGTADSDVFAAARIDGYFAGQQGQSAFLFSNGTIGKFNFSSAFPGYYNNPGPPPPSPNQIGLNYVNPNAHTSIFPTYAQMKAAAEPYTSNTMGGTINLDGKTRLRTGDLTLNTTSFCGTAGATKWSGTIIVEGSLTITGDNISYCAPASGASNNRLLFPSVGFIVTGNITINSNVRSVVGSYFADGTFTTLTQLPVGSTNDALVDPVVSPSCKAASVTARNASFTLCGLMIANNFNLQRQISAGSIVSGAITEQFLYDGRVVINPPPGFTSLYSQPAVWNEAVPVN